MEKKFILPASTFLGGIIVWLLFFFFVGTGKNILWIELLSGIVIGGLIIFSAFSCKRADGPKSGNLFRSGVLLVLAILTYWKIGIVSAIVLLLVCISVFLIALYTKQPIPNINEN